MKLRQALKIANKDAADCFVPWGFSRWKQTTIAKAEAIAANCWVDDDKHGKQYRKTKGKR